MSDVDTVPSLPAALDAGPPLAFNVNNHQPPTSPPRRASPPPPPPTQKEEGPINHNSSGEGDDDDGGPPSPKADSEAETIIQSGRESMSPEKRRKYIWHEPKRRDDGNEPVQTVESDLPPNDLQVRKGDENAPEDRDRSGVARLKSPPSLVKTEKLDDQKAAPAPSEPKLSRKRSFSESVDGEGDAGRSIRQNHSAPRERERQDVSFPRPLSKDRSESPVRHVHKRTVSGPQLGASDAQRKKKGPAPLITGFQRHSSEDRQSVSSSTSGSPLPTAHLRKLGSVDGASASPARPSMAGHKKQRDQNGRTRLARACAAQELDTAIAKYAERPEDLNVADNAGNTPLQIAALEGSAPIVKFLLEAGCEIDTKNIDRDTPLIDAIENGHLDVVKLLLEAGANPRTLNGEGDEPYDLVPSDCDEYEEIRQAISNAKANPRQHRRSEERAASASKEPSSRRVSNGNGRDSTPAHGPRSPPPFTSAATKRKIVRREATRNDLLWTKATPENLQMFAAKGDMEGVANILNVGQKADSESMIAAAKGGHDEVISLLLGMGDADPDPAPVENGSHKPGFNTPMLAAIGRGNLAVIRILLDNSQFNPTRRLYKDRTYFDLSKERRAENWEEEYHLLHEAYEKYLRTKKARKADLSSPRRQRDKEQTKRPRRDSLSPVARPRKSIESSTRDPKEIALMKEKRRDALKEKAGVRTKPRKDSDALSVGSDETKAIKPTHTTASRGEDAPKRRRLIAGRPPHDRRRPSLPSSDSLSGREEVAKPRPNDPASRNGPPALKRGRSSASPERPRSRDVDSRQQDGQKKRRVLSEDGTPNITNGGMKKGHAATTDDDVKSSRQKDDDRDRRTEGGRESPASAAPARNLTEKGSVKEEPGKPENRELNDIPMQDAPQTDEKAEAEAQQRKEANDKAEAQAQQRKQAEAAEQARRAEEEARLAAEAEKARLEKEKEEEERAARAARLAEEKAAEKAADEERKRKEAEQKRAKQAEDERQKRLEQDRLRLAKQRRDQEEQEQRRRDALPSRLRVAANLVGANDPRAKSHEWLRRFMPVVTADTKQLVHDCDAEVADEKWVPNYLVAPLLATNDLQLAQYPSWEKRNATPTQRMNLWRVTRRMLVQAADEPDFLASSFGQVMRMDCEARPKYFDMEHVFWVKLSDFMDLVPHIPHLHGLDLQFLQMHIDGEPLPSSRSVEYAPNGHGHGHLGELANGLGHRPSTYV